MLLRKLENNVVILAVFQVKQRLWRMCISPETCWAVCRL